MAEEGEEASDIEPKRYKLRAFSEKKTSTLHFQPARRNYLHHDNDPLTPEQAKATLQFLLDTSLRTISMSQAFYDVEALESLLEERERDLELAARIGQTLLEKNRQLVDQINELEEALDDTTEQNSQLKHSIYLKDELLKGFDDGVCSGESTPSISGRIFRGGYTVQEHINQLEERIQRLQRENNELRKDINETVGKLETKEEEYCHLVDGSVKDLDSVSKRLAYFRQELTKKTNECFEQQEQVTKLLTQLVDAQRLKKLKEQEAEENLNAFEESQRSQAQIIAEFHELEQKYLETVRLLEESRSPSEACNCHERNLQQEIMEIQTPFSLPGRKTPKGASDGGKSNNQKEQNIDKLEPESNDQTKMGDSGLELLSSTLIALDAEAKNLTHNMSHNSLAEVHCGRPYETPTRVLPDPICTPPKPPIDSGLLSPALSTSFTSVKSAYSSIMSSGFNTPVIGKAGVPGSSDLAKALNRLASRRRAETARAQERRNRSKLYKDSLVNDESFHSYHHQKPRRPEKYKLIKTMEGSPVMAQWRQMSQVDLDAAVSEIKHQNSPTERRKFSFPKRPDPIGSEALYCQHRSSSPTSGRPRIPSNSPDQSPVVKSNPLRLDHENTDLCKQLFPEEILSETDTPPSSPAEHSTHVDQSGSSISSSSLVSALHRLIFPASSSTNNASKSSSIAAPTIDSQEFKNEKSDSFSSPV